MQVGVDHAAPTALEAVRVVVAAKNAWVGLVVAAVIAPFTIVIAIRAFSLRTGRKSRWFNLLAGACFWVVITIGVAIGGYARTAGAALVAAGFVGFLVRSLVAFLARTGTEAPRGKEPLGHSRA